MPERFKGEFLTMGRYTNLSSLHLYLYLYHLQVNEVYEIY